MGKVSIRSQPFPTPLPTEKDVRRSVEVPEAGRLPQHSAQYEMENNVDASSHLYDGVAQSILRAVPLS